MKPALKNPSTETEFNSYYDLRWRILREPWNQPRGSEKDDLENVSVHIMACDDEGNVIGVGRGHMNSHDEAQVRFMAVDERFRGKGVGGLVLEELEKRMKDKGARYIVLNARENATGFYEMNGYRIVGKGHTLFGAVAHFLMRKDL